MPTFNIVYVLTNPGRSLRDIYNETYRYDGG